MEADRTPSAACDHCDDTGEVLEPSRTPEEPDYMIPCANCQDGSAAKLCLARWEAGRSYPCALPKGHDGQHQHPMDPVPTDHFLAASA